uniref:Uncharacterized protein n=1 Tax=Ascaris lumbricoides TaxID=6252 RepID=A0A0M3I437_ASCLU
MIANVLMAILVILFDIGKFFELFQHEFCVEVHEAFRMSGIRSSSMLARGEWSVETTALLDIRQRQRQRMMRSKHEFCVEVHEAFRMSGIRSSSMLARGEWSVETTALLDIRQRQRQRMMRSKTSNAKRDKGDLVNYESNEAYTKSVADKKNCLVLFLKINILLCDYIRFSFLISL